MVRSIASRSWVLVVAWLLLLGVPSSTEAGTCTSGCATITVSQYTGPIDLGCGSGDVKVKIVVNYNCGPDCQGQVIFYRCGASSQNYTFQCNQDRTFNVYVFGTWADALVECNSCLLYTS